MTRSHYILEKTLEQTALVLLERYCHRFTQPMVPCMPLEEVIECLLELSFGFEDMATRFGSADILGATLVDSREILIDMSLDPCEHPEREGRYRFTLAHEIGHWELHRQQVVSRDQRSLFDADPSGTILCRARQSDQREWQANQFAAYALMPTSLVSLAWENCTGSSAPHYVSEAQMTARRWALGDEYVQTLPIAREMAQVFHVSGQAMQIRLQGMGLITTRAATSGTLTVS